LLTLPKIVKAARRETFIQPHRNIDVAWVQLAPRRGPEQGCAHHAPSSELLCVLAQNEYDFFAGHIFILPNLSPVERLLKFGAREARL
jgi:hypothetical protein